MEIQGKTYFEQKTNSGYRFFGIDSFPAPHCPPYHKKPYGPKGIT